jgi:hypothetical protein
MTEQEIRDKIYNEIMNNKEILEDSKALGSDAYLVASRTRWACAVIAKGLVTNATKLNP